MNRNPLADVGQRLGCFAYMTVMGGGVPFWPALFDGAKAVDELYSTSRPEGVTSDRNPFDGTVPYEYRSGQGDPIAA